MSNKHLPTRHQAKKRFGQNFLVDQGIINHIVRSVSPKEDDNIVEIGPGQGAITGIILDSCPSLQVVELDRDLIPVLLAQFAKFKDFKIHQTDALKFDFSSLCEEGKGPLRIVGNLPYNISTPLIFHLISFEEKVSDMHFMLQKEVVERLAAGPRHKNYGRLSIMAQYYCQVEHLFDVPPESFSPAPKVDSAIVRLTPHKIRPFPADDITTFENLVKAAFSQRRKTLRNALKKHIDDEKLTLCQNALNLDFGNRAETLTLEQYVLIANYLHTLEKN